nr:MAG TPA: hypothetical protein [Crassvirales sp.]DAW89908.1 MAG TPA: hypothetical protein [Caudoviricetes sp.]DAX07728.1 MAG TPA: hypothetical protein [Caudoviricetes sp.]
MKMSAHQRNHLSHLLFDPIVNTANDGPNRK